MKIITNNRRTFIYLNDELYFEYYDSQTEKLLFKQSALAFSGYRELWNNIGKVNNKGFEIELTTVNLSSKDFE